MRPFLNSAAPVLKSAVYIYQASSSAGLSANFFVGLRQVLPNFRRTAMDPAFHALMNFGGGKNAFFSALNCLISFSGRKGLPLRFF